MANYSSNCPISRPVVSSIEEDADFGGVSWSNKHGFFFPADQEQLPIKHPSLLSYRPTVR